MATGFSAGTLLIKKVNQSDDFVEEVLDSSDIPVTTTGSNFIDANISGSNIQQVFSSVADSLNLKILEIKEDDIQILPNASSLNFYTGLSVVDDSGEAQISINESEITSFVSLTSSETIGGNKTFSDNVLIEGNLTVTGAVTTLDTAQLLVEDNIITLNSTFTGNPSAGIDGGIEVERGTGANSRLIWDESEDYWSLGVSGSESRIITNSILSSLDLNLTYSTSSFVIKADTSDGSDNKQVTLAGGGEVTGAASDRLRGARVIVCGDDHSSTPGDLVMDSGSNGIIRFRSGVNTFFKWMMNAAGHWVPFTDNTYTIGDATARISAVYTRVVLNLVDNLILRTVAALELRTGGDVLRWSVLAAGDLEPGSDGAYDVGSSTKGVKQVHLSDTSARSIVEMSSSKLRLLHDNNVRMEIKENPVFFCSTTPVSNSDMFNSSITFYEDGGDLIVKRKNSSGVVTSGIVSNV